MIRSIVRSPLRARAADLTNTRLSGRISGSIWAIGDIRLKVRAGSRRFATKDSRATSLGRYPLAAGGTLSVKRAPA